MTRTDETYARHLSRPPPRAAAFIVSVYGDVVVPRGGILSMGTLIEICAEAGISETLVRTAVSRLVAAGQLTGERSGRRSFYRLTEAARVEFLEASRVIFGAEPPATGFLIVPRPDAENEPRLLREGFAVTGLDLMIGPDRPLVSLPMPVLRASIADATGLPAFAARFWDLAPQQAAYRAFVERFEAVAVPSAPAEALLLRLLLVHAYRQVLLRDPRLPVAALPADWAGGPARSLFARLYVALSELADSHVGATFLGAEGPLATKTDETEARLAALRTGLRSPNSL